MMLIVKMKFILPEASKHIKPCRASYDNPPPINGTADVIIKGGCGTGNVGLGVLISRVEATEGELEV